MEKANLFIIGAAKCGTTSLHEYLGQHPDIFMSAIKEPHYFSNVDQLLHDGVDEEASRHSSLIKDELTYHKLFKNGQNQLYRGESSPSYLWHDKAAQNIYNYNPHSKIIILLRDPIMRAFSHFQMAVQAGFQKKVSFYTAIKEDLAVPEEEIGWNKSHMYVALGFYYRQINRYSKIFPEEQMMIIKFEDFVKDINSGMSSISKFLNVDPSKFPDLNSRSQHNRAMAPKYPIIDLLKENWFVQKMLSLLPENLKNTVKSKTHREGYRKDLVLDNPSQKLLNQLYRDELLSLNEIYGIDYNMKHEK